jgi:hypothetical protein
MFCYPQTVVARLPRSGRRHRSIRTSSARIWKWRMTQSSALRRGLSPKLRQNFVGQLLTNSGLIRSPCAASRATFLVGRTTAAAAAGTVRGYPDYTAGSLLAIAMSRKTGVFDSPLHPLGSAIPRHIVQYWDDAPPSDIPNLMATSQHP